MHLRGKAMQMSAISRSGQVRVLSYVSGFNFVWMSSYLYADDSGAAARQTILKGRGVARPPRRTRTNPDPNIIGWLRRPHGRRNGHAW